MSTKAKPVPESDSDFLAGESPNALFPRSGLRLIHHSEKGCFDIYRYDHMGRFRAMKCLQPQYRSQPLYEALLRKEFEIGYSLRHPGIVEYYEFHSVEGLGNCIEMEWVDGLTLEEFLRDNKVPRDQARRILDELCDALAYMHSRGVIHRDIKPSNILLTHTGTHVRLIDFGFSDSDAHSILKTPAGTRCYTAPEVLEGGKADVRSDIWSLGLVIAELSPRHRRVAHRCCRPQPARRFASVAQVRQALHARRWLPLALLLLLAAALLALLPLLRRPQPSQPQEATPAAETQHPLQPQTPDAQTQQPPQQQQQQQPSPTATAPKKETSPKKEDVPVDAATIDELFRQATDLFD